MSIRATLTTPAPSPASYDAEVTVATTKEGRIRVTVGTLVTLDLDEGDANDLGIDLLNLAFNSSFSHP